MDGVGWEMKAPKASGQKAFDRVLRRAVHQSHNVIIDAIRIEGSPDIQIEHDLRRVATHVKELRRLILVKKNRAVVDIKR